MNNYPLVSIIIPVYNVEKYIHRCLDSVISQEISNLEIILVDDGSPDNCPRICDNYAKFDKRIKVIHKPNGGLSSAIIAGLEESNGDYICFLDSDDWLKDNWWQKLKPIFDEYDDIDLINFNFDRYFMGEFSKAANQLHLNGYYSESNIDIVKGHYMHPNYIGPTRWNKVYKRKLAFVCLKTYSSKISIGEDICFTAIAIDSMKSCYILNESLMNYNINENSMTVNYNERFLQSFNELYLSLSVSDMNREMLHYIDFINLRTLVNAIYKTKNIVDKKSEFNKIYKNEEIIKRLDWVNKKKLGLKNRMILYFMKHKLYKCSMIVCTIYNRGQAK